MKICKVTQDDFQEWLSLALELWPDYSSVEMEVSLTNLLHSDREQGILVKDDHGCAIAFMNLSLRSDNELHFSLSRLGSIPNMQKCYAAKV